MGTTFISPQNKEQFKHRTEKKCSPTVRQTECPSHYIATHTHTALALTGWYFVRRFVLKTLVFRFAIWSFYFWNVLNVNAIWATANRTLNTRSHWLIRNFFVDGCFAHSMRSLSNAFSLYFVLNNRTRIESTYFGMTSLISYENTNTPNSSFFESYRLRYDFPWTTTFRGRCTRTQTEPNHLTEMCSICFGLKLHFSSGLYRCQKEERRYLNICTFAHYIGFQCINSNWIVILR